MQEFPDTMQVNYEFAGKTPKLLTYEMRVWCRVAAARAQQHLPATGLDD